MKPTKETIISDAEALLKANKTKEKAFATADGNIFWEKPAAAAHAKRNNLGDIIEIARPAFKEVKSAVKLKEEDPGASAQDFTPPSPTEKNPKVTKKAK